MTQDLASITRFIKRNIGKRIIPYDLQAYTAAYIMQDDIDCEIGGKTLLLYASKSGDYNLSKYLIENGANINFQDEEGISALTYAAINNKYKCVELLLDHDADINYDMFSSTITYICELGFIECLKVFLNYEGIDMECLDYENTSALHLAAGRGHIECVKLLLNNGFNVNCKTIYNSTPIDYAIYRGNDQIFKLLLNFGAEIPINLIKEPIVKEYINNKLKKSQGPLYQKIYL